MRGPELSTPSWYATSDDHRRGRSFYFRNPRLDTRRAIVDLVVIPFVGGVIGGAIAGPWGVFLGVVVGLYAGASYGTPARSDQRVRELERQVAEKEQRIDELEGRLEEPDDE